MSYVIFWLPTLNWWWCWQWGCAKDPPVNQSIQQIGWWRNLNLAAVILSVTDGAWKPWSSVVNEYQMVNTRGTIPKLRTLSCAVSSFPSSIYQFWAPHLPLFDLISMHPWAGCLNPCLLAQSCFTILIRNNISTLEVTAQMGPCFAMLLAAPTYIYIIHIASISRLLFLSQILWRRRCNAGHAAWVISLWNKNSPPMQCLGLSRQCV